MKPKGRIVLVELLIAFLFFSLSAVIALQLFAHGYEFSYDSTLRADALREAQSLADRLYASDSAEALLAETGFAKIDSAYARDDGEITYTVELSAHGTESGVMQNAVVTALEGDTVLFSLPVKRYEGGGTP